MLHFAPSQILHAPPQPKRVTTFNHDAIRTRLLRKAKRRRAAVWWLMIAVGVAGLFATPYIAAWITLTVGKLVGR